MGFRILIVEDESSVASLLDTALRRAGFAVRVARNAGEARSHCQDPEATFDLAIVDLTLPDEPGLYLLPELRARRTDIPVIFMSGLPADVPAGTWFVGKPFLPRQMLELVGRILAA